MELDVAEKTKKTKDVRKPKETCHSCGKTGHYARDCRNKKKKDEVSAIEKATSRKVRRKKPTIEKTSSEVKNVDKSQDRKEKPVIEKTSSEEEKKVVKSEELKRIESNKERLIRFKGRVNGREAWMLLDSGSSKNFIDAEYIKRHHLKSKPKKKYVTLSRTHSGN